MNTNVQGRPKFGVDAYESAGCRRPLFVRSNNVNPAHIRFITAFVRSIKNKAEIALVCVERSPGGPEARLSQNPPLVFPGEIRRLRAALARASAGKAFVLQGGDCAESFDHFNAASLESTFRVLIAQSIVLSYLSGQPVLKIGRVAGQFAKPRSNDMEDTAVGSIPVYRGDIINSAAESKDARVPEPERLLRAYSQSAASLNMLRALAKSTQSMMEWVSLINRLTPEKYAALVTHIEDALNFVAACGLDTSASTEGLQNMREPEFYSSHEALLLTYEAALTRQSMTSSGHMSWYCSSAHMLWVGERTRQLEGAHVEFLRGIENPTGVKLGPTADPAEVLTMLDTLNPDNDPGKIMLIIRMGQDKLMDRLPALLRAVKQEGRHVVWSVDPMHWKYYKGQWCQNASVWPGAR
ncbi:Phospho-2-dehydro-3-deoxyheptonate aldolase 1, chloroplastic [Gracilariopsis chorda]|uniref:Phospho-2-dehydro-3-deoxyheptonate aldolase n=2 Tax=Gracilariopsis chorda TaxID=448386 RepID=A0A2V3IEC0_9FLOR|nr:Phospho-2-dehydro-3-deoxyheptonate aldolase 1, chloroplastic [Gracilariopsis chorda]|eukprot:PXF40436.1 Phospho-2-dehydro-3-deoxyheptonate aldolase 1, chloroplastic [Gracilariopsis chorda]